MVEENGTSGGNGDPLAQSPNSGPHPIVTSVREPTIVTYTPTSHKVLVYQIPVVCCVSQSWYFWYGMLVPHEKYTFL